MKNISILFCDRCGGPIDDLHMLRTPEGRREWVCFACWLEAKQAEDARQLEERIFNGGRAHPHDFAR